MSGGGAGSRRAASTVAAWLREASSYCAPEPNQNPRPAPDPKQRPQGVDYEGRALAIVRVRNHLSSKRCIRQMRLFSAFTLDSLVRRFEALCVGG